MTTARSCAAGEARQMFKIKDLEIHGDMVLAPLAGYTDSPYRRLARSHGAAMVFTELISAEGIVRNSAKTLDLTRFTGEERPVGIQLFGKDPEVMGEAALRIEELAPDLIDINLGCCAQRICSNGGGASLLRDLGLVEKIVTAIINKVSLPVSAKIRLGWDENSKNYRETVKCLEGTGIALISVHGRTRAQKYGNSADWTAIKEIAEQARVPVVGNGDIRSFDEARTRLKESGCSAVMIGRGAIGNPWIFSGVFPDTGEMISQIKRHLRLMRDYYGEYGTILMRKHLVKYIHGIRNAAVIRGKIMVTADYNEVTELLDSILENETHENHPMGQ